MKKNLLLRLCLMMVVVLSFNSCRQDLLPEKETYHNTSAFQLTSKRISLNESKHKAKLIHELEKVEAELKAFSKTNAQGKVISYANGVSIDTDNVTYIENGPDYHTYTFNLTRDNALPTDPVENLVLTPLADGSYKELLITYNLTSQEKEALMIGASVDTKGKTTITELAKGSYNSGGQLARFNCGYQSTTIWVNCCHNGYHNPTNVDDWANCVCPPEGQPNVYTVVSYVCAPVYETITPTDPGGSSGGGGGGGGNTPCTDCPPVTQTPTEPCNGNGVLTGPFDPVLSQGDGSCGGVVTTPTLPIRNNPCEKVKNITNNTTGLKDKIKNLNTPDNLALNYERGALVADNAQGESMVTSIDGNPGETFINVYTPPTGEQTALVHTHFEGSTMSPIFSFDDLVVFDAIHFYRKTNNKPLDKVTIMVISKEGVFALVIDNSTLFYNMGGEMMTNREFMRNKFNGDLQEKVSVTYGDIIKQVAKVLPEYGISLYKATDDQLNSWNKITYNPATDIVNEVPCN